MMVRSFIRRLVLIPPVLGVIHFLGYAYAHYARPIRAARTPYLPFIPQQTPLLPTYTEYIWALFSRDLTPQQAASLHTIALAAKASLGLLALAILFSVLSGLFIGLKAVRNHPPSVSRWLTLITTSGLAMPSFYIGSLLIVASFRYAIWAGPEVDIPLPIQGFGWDRHLVLPVLALMTRPMVQIAQLTAGLLAGELSKQVVHLVGEQS